jgi:hypothetical protein
VASKTRWLSFWERHGPNMQAPEVDFAKFFIVACFPEGKFTGVSEVSAAADGRAVTLTVVLGEKEASPEAYKAQYAIVVLPRTTRPIVVRTRVAECGAINPKRDKQMAELTTTCATPDNCHATCRKDVAACFDCGKGKRSSCDALCGACASSRGVCHKCGLAPEPCRKPGRCHDTCIMSAKSCGECAATINGCDTLCEKCSGKTRCPQCGRPAEKK